MRAIAFVLVLVAAVLASCTILPRPIPPGTSEACVYLDDQALAWSAVGAAAGGMATAAGTSAAAIAGSGIDDAGAWSIGLGAAGGVLAVLGTVAGLLVGEYASRVAAECGPSP